MSGRIADRSGLKATVDRSDDDRPAVSDEAAALLERVTSGVVIVDERLELLHANAAARELLGFRHSEPAGFALLSLLPGLKNVAGPRTTRSPAEVLFADLIGKSTVVHGIFNGRSGAVEVAAARQHDAGGDRWVLTIRDVSALEGDHRRLLRAHHELEDFNRMAVGRELRMIEMKREVNALLRELGRAERYGDLLPG